MRQDLVATYRLQLQPAFGFREAAAIVPYLRDLGVSHLYLSPCFEAMPGSTHGYDVVNPNRLRAELGGAPAFDALVATAHEHSLGLILDIVPHHMAASAANEWWWSVLAQGQKSPYAGHFDIDWDSREDRLRGIVLLPVLGDHYGRVLEAGELRLALDEDDIVVCYHDNVAPLSKETADEVWAEAGRRGCDVRGVLEEINADVVRLDALLDRQHHRFARWQTAAHDLDYRRFFDIDSLVALRSERPQVFDHTHRLTQALVGTDKVDGLRIDHIDGLRDPDAYLARLRAVAPSAWIGVEKVLRFHESLPDRWPVDGTTGYEFLAEVAGLLVHPEGVRRLTDAYARFVDDVATYSQVANEARRDALRDALDADLRRVVSILVRVCEANRRWRDFTRSELRDALAEICVQAPGYRSYVRAGAPATEADREFVTTAVARARVTRPDLDADLLDFLRSLLLGELPGEEAAELVARFQQLTGPVAAKGEEDTAFYRWVPLLVLNDVGTQPDRPTLAIDEFHSRNERRQQQWPRTMLTTSTHDTKRGEDVRARLAVLSEQPDEWVSAVDRWHAMNDRHRAGGIGAPDRHDEWFIYQTLAGAHPLPFDRAWPVIEKSLREAKRRTDWVRVDAAYEDATRSFLESIVSDEAFLRDLDRVVNDLVDAGHVNSLTQVALRLLSPGVPDTYQGCELWDSSLVDPDNRRPVDYSVRAEELSSIADARFDEVWAGERALGRPKLALIRTALDLRRRHPDAFGRQGRYTPLAIEGTGADRLIAFARGDEVVLAVHRWPKPGPPDNATVELPVGQWINVLTGKPHSGRVPFGELRGGAPLALLEVDLDPVA